MAKSSLSGNELLDHNLAPLMKLLERPKLIELMVVRFEEVQLEIEGKDQFVVERVPALNEKYWYTLARILAQLEETTFDPETSPFVSTKLPGGHRLELLLGRWSESGISVSIRVFRNLTFPLEFYGLPTETADELRQAMRDNLNIFVSGGTASGKTTLTNSLLKEVPGTIRILSVEDVRELQFPHVSNRVYYNVDRWGRGVTYDRLFDHLMRARGDRLLMGELSTKNVQAAAMLLSTGHRGFMTTLHSNGCLEALETAFHDRLELSGRHVDRDHLTAYLRRNVDLIIQVAKTERGRRITELWRPALEDKPRILQ